MKHYIKEGAHYSFTLGDSREYIAKCIKVPSDDVVLFDKPAIVLLNGEGKVEIVPATLTGDIINPMIVPLSSIQTILPSHENAVEAYSQIVEKTL